MSPPIVVILADDGGVIARARRGDRQAFGELVRKYQRRVHATALQITANSSDADDVAQEAFVRAFRAIGKFDGRADVFTWLYRITVNTALNHKRSQKRVSNLARAGSDRVKAEGGRPERPGESPASPEHKVALSRRTKEVLEGLSSLSPTLRVTLVMATVHELSYKQIAQILEIPEGTVAWRVNEARKKLRALVDEPRAASAAVATKRAP